MNTEEDVNEYGNRSQIHGHDIHYKYETGEWEHINKKYDVPEYDQDQWGNKIYYDEKDEEYKYLTSDCIAERPCKRCGEHPTLDGHDYCLGNLGNNVTSACCGHGIRRGFILFRDGRLFIEIAGKEYTDIWDTLPNKKGIRHALEQQRKVDG